eukprot:9124386-Alexandrium_andersonii.AAC.1
MTDGDVADAGHAGCLPDQRGREAHAKMEQLVGGAVGPRGRPSGLGDGPTDRPVAEARRICQ